MFFFSLSFSLSFFLSFFLFLQISIPSTKETMNIQVNSASQTKVIERW